VVDVWHRTAQFVAGVSDRIGEASLTLVGNPARPHAFELECRGTTAEHE
jgi:hypothetical protein